MNEQFSGYDNKNIRVVHPHFFAYDQYIKELKLNLGEEIPRLHIDTATFADSSPYLQIVTKERDLRQGSCALVPFWISSQFRPFGENLTAVLQTVEALTHKDKGKNPIAKRVIGIAPYLELRQDRNTAIDGTEAISTELIAKTLAAVGMKELIILDPHSSEAIESFENAGISCLCLTAIPLFVRYLKQQDFSGQLIALDKGSLQRNLHACELLGFDPRYSLTIFDKKRNGHNSVGSSTLIWGNPQGENCAFIDDLLDTSKSLGSNSQDLLNQYKVKKIIAMMSHGVNSYPGRENILKLISKGTINELVLTDSLPKAKYDFEDQQEIIIFPTASLLAKVALLVAATSVEEAQKDPLIAPFILKPKDKEEVWKELISKYNAPFPHQESFFDVI